MTESDVRERTTHPLIRQYPQFFDLTKPGGGLADGGFCTGRGWDGILAVMLWRLAQLPLPGDFKLDQIKEKFGLLRVYDNERGGECDRAVKRIIASAENASATVCEWCGATGASKDNNGFWLKTLCAECATKRRQSTA